MRFQQIKRVTIQLSETDIKENRIHFDQATIHYLGLTDISKIQIDGDEDHYLRADDFGHGARIEKLSFINENFNHLFYVNRNIEIEILSRKPCKLKFYIIQ
ncbi:hypothetical protein [Paenibacillus polymyxa]|uniref:hypothetical protein n=1 Tax=Paenibacillus polymyxa TaxID=1406 RepID=UPI000C9FDAEA|nr:hypothetical protein [Paenibacillus polymyxa]PNQ84116.1 hypothetical protein C1T20_19315 [Paenibacillus polymyxa]